MGHFVIVIAIVLYLAIIICAGCFTSYTVKRGDMSENDALNKKSEVEKCKQRS